MYRQYYLQQLNQEPPIQELEGEWTVSARSHEQILRDLPEPRIIQRSQSLRLRELFRDLRHLKNLVNDFLIIKWNTRLLLFLII